MSRGGKREGAGRKVGSKLQKSAAIAHRLAEDGQTPLDFIVGLMRDESQPIDLRLDCAKAAAPYIHPRLAMVHNKIEGESELTKEQSRNVLLEAWEFARKVNEEIEEEKCRLFRERMPMMIDATPAPVAQ
jgi:hypothetical protein